MKKRFTTGADGSASYTTVDGDMIDEIAYAYYGKHIGNTEAIYAANTGLADRGAVLPAGVTVKLPAATKETPKTFIRLWD